VLFRLMLCWLLQVSTAACWVQSLIVTCSQKFH